MQWNNKNNEHNDSLSALIDLIPAALLVIDPTGKIMAANKMVRIYTGLEKEDLIGTNFLKQNLFGVAEERILMENIRERQAGSNIAPYEIRIRTEKGKVRFLEVTSNKINYNGMLCDLIVFRDVTERSEQEKQLEQNLFETEERFNASELKWETLFDLVPDNIVTFDKNGIVTFVNRAALESSGYTKDEVVGKHFSKLTALRPRDMAKYFRIYLAIKSGKNPKPFEVKYRNKAGIECVAETHYSVIKEKGKVVGLVAVSRDRTAEKETERALHENEEKFHGIANSVRDAVILVDGQTKITYWNPAAEKIFGYAAEEAIGRDIHQLVVPPTMSNEAKERLRAGVKTFSETGIGYFTVGNVEVVGHRKDGSEFPAKLAISPMKLAGKWHAVGVVKDIAERKQNEQKVREAEQRYHALFNQAPVGVLLIDPKTAAIVEFNDIAPEQLHYSRDEFRKLTIPDIEVQESATDVRSHIDKMLEQGWGEFETKHRTKFGEIRNVLVTVRTVELADKIFLHSIFHDITEIRSAQNALKESEAQYRRLVELAQEGIWALNNDFDTVFVNPRMAKMLGYTESEMTGESLFKFVRQGDLEKATEFLTKWKSGVTGTFEYSFPRKDGTEIYTSIASSKIEDDKGQSIGTLALVADITERKQAEQALRESEELSKAIVANAPLGIATSDRSYHFLTANQTFCKILGYTEDELRSLTFKEITDPGDLQDSIREMDTFQSSKKSFAQEKRYIKKDGTVIIGKVIINAIWNPKGEPILFIAELEDITQQKQLENNLKASEERFRAISTSAMDAIILANGENKIIYWNPAAEKTFGFLENEILGKEIAELINLPHGLGKQSLSEGRFEAIALRKDGLRFPVDISFASVNVRENKCLLAIARDISEQKQMEASLKQERNMLEDITENIGAGLVIVDKNYRILWINKFLKNLQGDTVNKTCYSTYNNLEIVCPGCGPKRIFEGSPFDSREYFNKALHEQGLPCWFELIATPIKDANGRVIAALELTVDITERKRMQDKLAEYSRRLEDLVQKRTEMLKKAKAELVRSERLAAIGELAGMIGHDLRNPLSGIKNSAYFLKKKGEQISPTQAKEMLETIDRCVDSSNKIVNDLLDYSREIRLDLQECSPRKLLIESLAMVNAPEKIQVINNVSEEPLIQIDAEKMKRVFINLMKNAIDAMPNGGILTLGSKQAGNNLEISIADTGSGIPEDLLPKLFSPLVTTKAQGMGFGLAICKRLTEAHGGTIKVQTTKNKGTTFTITLSIESKLENGGEKTWMMTPESLLSTTTKQ